MSTAAAMRHEVVQEREDPLNRLLGSFEGQIIACIDLGLEPQLRTIIERLLPAPKPEPSQRDLEFQLGMAGVLTVLKRYATWKDSEAGHRQNAAARGFVMTQLEIA